MATAPWLTEGHPDEMDAATAEDLIGQEILGRFACGLCAENRDAAEAAERDVRELRAELDRAQALLRLILRAQMRPAERESDQEDARELALVGFAVLLASIRARIEIYFQAAGLTPVMAPAPAQAKGRARS